MIFFSRTRPGSGGILTRIFLRNQNKKKKDPLFSAFMGELSSSHHQRIRFPPGDFESTLASYSKGPLLRICCREKLSEMSDQYLSCCHTEKSKRERTMYEECGATASPPRRLARCVLVVNRNPLFIRFSFKIHVVLYIKYLPLIK